MRNFKIVIAAVALLLTSNFSFGQGTLAKGSAQLNAGLGFSEWGVPVYVGFDYGIHRDITIGGEFSFRHYRDHQYGNDYDNTIYCFVANGNYHFNRLLQLPKEFDVYAGASLGFYAWSSESGYDRHHDPFYPSIQVGGRYFIKPNFGFNVELGGGGVSGGKFGITYKF